VRPFKCLHGNYKSRELYIPSKCEFAHLYSNDGCQTQDHWTLLASQKCESGSLSLNSSKLLKWCDAPGTFEGVEFVCCPKKYDFISPQAEVKNYEDEDIDDEYDYEDIPNYSYDAETLIGGEEAIINSHDYNDVNFVPENHQAIKNLEEMKADMDKLDTNEFINEFNKVKKIFDKLSVVDEEATDMEAVEGTLQQKEQYEKQKNFIVMSIQNTTENLIKEKKTTVFTVEKTKDESNSIFYETMLRNLDDQYQIRFDKLNKEKDRLLFQEETSYEQQVQGRINEKKLNTGKILDRAMSDLEQKLNLDDKDLETLVKAVNDFYIAQENDRLHMVTVYKKLKAYFPDKIKERSQSIINHLNSIDKTLNETSSILSTKFKQLSKCIIPLLKEHLKRYDQVKDESKRIRRELQNYQANYIITDLRPTPAPEFVSDKWQTSRIQQAIVTNSKNTNMQYYEGDFEEQIDYDDSYYDNGSSEEVYDENIDYNSVPRKISKPVDKNINIKRISEYSKISTFVLLSAVSLGILFSLILMYVLIKRNRLRAQSIVKHGFLPVDTANPEDKHVNSMQTNGYENPTYKYFESNSVHA